MKNLWIVFIVLALAWACYAEEEFLIFRNNTDFAIDIWEKVTHTIGVQATNRDEMIRVFIESYGAWADDSCVSITVGDYTEEYATPDEVPMGSIYLMRGNWLIYYEQNKGYMELWR